MIEPSSIRGWMLPESLGWLTAHAQWCRTIIEIGCYRGRSTAALLRGLPHGGTLWCIDNWSGIDGAGDDGSRDEFLSTFREELTHGRMRLLEMRSDEAYFLTPLDVDLVFIDGGHDYADVSKDIKLYRRRVRRGGILSGHDYGTYRGVTAAVNESFSHKVLVGPDSIWSVRI